MVPAQREGFCFWKIKSLLIFHQYAKISLTNVEVVKLEVPTVFRKSIATVATAIAKEKPDAVLCIGQAGGRYDITRGIEAAIGEYEEDIRTAEGQTH